MQHNILIHRAKTSRSLGYLAVFTILVALCSPAQAAELDELFTAPPESAKPWVFWYWVNGGVSREGITADLEAMQRVGLGGAYLMPIKGPTDPPLVEPAVVQLSPEWWELVQHAMEVADRTGIKLGMHACDGFAVAGGPWITPERSMQKVVWSETHVEGGKQLSLELPQPESREGHYRDISVLAFPSLTDSGISTATASPSITSSTLQSDLSFLVDNRSEGRVRMEKPGWIEYKFPTPFVCRSITITPDGNNYQSQRLLLQVSDDGKNFREIVQLTPPRHGWQNGDGTVTHAIPATEARYYRFVFDPAGSEPGSEDLDSAKWSPVLKARKIHLSSEPTIHQYRGKTGSVWRIGARTTSRQVPKNECIPVDQILDLTGKTDAHGHIRWDAPTGQWTILRLGHTSTGTRNETGGGGKGLECDKFNPHAVRLQFDSWFGEVVKHIGPELASRVLTTFHVDSWECGSQNWTPEFAKEFQTRRGYDLTPYLVAFTGRPVGRAGISERFLYDVRQTISELLQENFFGTMATLAREKGCNFSAECVAPTMCSDGMRHFAKVDVPMGEFWLQSPTHDKPNDMQDAISAAHVYGKRIVQAEAFTQLRMDWNEHPGMLKALGDSQYCRGINRLVYHVYVQNPWLDRMPGMTLDNIGLLFQRDQTWWYPGRAWIDYAKRCQALLQFGEPVVDIAVFTGEELPRRSVLPERLVDTLPGLLGLETIQQEQIRLANIDTPTREMPRGVRHSANMVDQAEWLDPLHGYAFDSLDRHTLLSAEIDKHGRFKTSAGMTYQLLVVPGPRPMSPHSKLMTPEVAEQISSLASSGARLSIAETPAESPSLVGFPECDERVRSSRQEILRLADVHTNGQGNTQHDAHVAIGPLLKSSLSHMGIEPDLLATEADGASAKGIGWVHRRSSDVDVYFISNQLAKRRIVDLSFRVAGKVPEFWDPVTADRWLAKSWDAGVNRTQLSMSLAPHGSLFVVFRNTSTQSTVNGGKNWHEPKSVTQLAGPWNLSFDTQPGTSPVKKTFPALTDWSKNDDDAIRYFSGTAVYRTTFQWSTDHVGDGRYWLDLGKVANLAEVKLNGKDCGVTWTFPHRLEISGLLQGGTNDLEIHVTNTWHNRLVGDEQLPEAERITWTKATRRPKGRNLQPAGLLGPVQILVGSN